MKKSLLIALFAAMPIMAQDCPQKPECAPKKPCCMKMHRGHRPQLTAEQKAEMKAKFEARQAEMKAKFMEKFDTDKDGKISDAEKEAIKAQFEAKKAEMKAKFMEKFDTNKDGQLSDEEKAAAKAEFKKNAPKFRKHGRKGPRFGKKGPRRPHGPRPQLTEEQKAEMKAKFMEKFDTNKDGQLSDEEKAAAKAEFKKNAPKFRKHGRKGPRFHRGQRPCCGKKFQRPQLTEEQKAEMKAKFEAKKAEMKAKFMEKFDTDKDGKISDAEKEAIKAEFKKNAPKFRKHGRKGPRFHRGQRPCNCKRQK